MSLYRPRGGGFKAVSCNHRISLHGCLCEAPAEGRRAPCGAPSFNKSGLVWAMLSSKAERLSKGFSLAYYIAQAFA